MNFGSALEQVHRRAPLVDCITNFVTVNDCANILLAVGGSPTMASDIREVQETAAAASALLCNLGAIDKVESMILGGQAANRAGKPVVFDPEGAGNTSLRRAESARLLDAVQFSVIRGNASEIRALAQRRAAGSGVDVSDADQITEKTLPRTVASARALAVQTGAVVAVSGPIDVLTDGRETILLHNGCATMSRVTGSGCMLTALMGAFCGAMPGQPFAAACAAAATMGVAGELAEARRAQDRQPRQERGAQAGRVHGLEGAQGRPRACDENPGGTQREGPRPVLGRPFRQRRAKERNAHAQRRRAHDDQQPHGGHAHRPGHSARAGDEKRGHPHG